MAGNNRQNDQWADLWLLIIPISVGSCAFMWWLNGAVWGLLAGILTFGLCYYHIIYKKKKS